MQEIMENIEKFNITLTSDSAGLKTYKTYS